MFIRLFGDPPTRVHSGWFVYAVLTDAIGIKRITESPNKQKPSNLAIAMFVGGFGLNRLK